jgi:dolichol-phosphate mannosyltransferase
MKLPMNDPEPGGPSVEKLNLRKAVVVIPTYNEADNIGRLVPLILARDDRLSVLVVDDNSPDGTADIVKGLPEFGGRVLILERPLKQGLGAAYIAAFQWILANTDFEAVFEMDADFSHDPEALDEFLVDIESHDLVLGSRYLHGITVVNWPLRRLILSVGANRYAGLVTGMRVKDCTGGFKCFRRSTLEMLPLDRIKSDGYSFQIEMTYHCWSRKLKIKEIPIMFVDRQVGVSKMSKRIIVEAIWMVWALRFRRIP